MKKFLSKISFSRLLFSVIFSFALFYMSKIVFLGMVYDNNYIDVVYFSEFKVLILLIPLIYLLMALLEKYYKKIYSIIIVEEEYENKKHFCIIAFIFLLLIYMVYYLTFFPGGVYIDTWTSLKMLTGEENFIFTNQQPVLYTLMMNLVKAFLPNLYLGFGIFTFIQVIIMISCIVYFIYWLLKKHVNPILVTFITIFFGFFSLYPLYSVSVWKDTPFSLAVFLYALTLIDLIMDFKNRNIKISNIVKLNIFALLSMFLRNNGLYIIVASTFLLFITYIPNIIKKNKVEHVKSFFISSVITICVFLIIENLYTVFGISDTFLVEKGISIPIQQVARVVVTDGNITEEQMELIEKVLPKEVIKEKYRALLVDPIKWDSAFNNEYLEEHKLDYLKLWFDLFLQNPDEYFRAYLLQTSGFWTFGVRGEESYASPIVWETYQPKLKNRDLILENSHFSFSNDLEPHSYYSGGFFFWITFISLLISFRISTEKKWLLGYLPAMLLWATVMISTPMGSALRYVYLLVLVLPLNLVYPAIAKNLSDKNN